MRYTRSHVWPQREILSSLQMLSRRFWAALFAGVTWDWDAHMEEHHGDRLTPAMAAAGSPRVRRVRRRAGHPAPTEMRLAWLAAMTALVMAAAITPAATVSGAAADEEGHQLGLREQWQPETENDPRLQQPVHTEIIGRAAVPGLEMLSEQTGVALAVAPDDLDTVGERKLTVIAQGCSLKAIMVQLPKALQECHWDVADSGDEPSYLLHRNGGAAYSEEYAKGVEAQRKAEELRGAREHRVESARRALAMSPEELAELEETDLFLARAARHPLYRTTMAGFLSIPADQMEHFLDTGEAELHYPSAPPQAQEAARFFGAALNEEVFDYFGGTSITPEKRREAAEHPERWKLWYWGTGGEGRVLLTIGVPIAGHYRPMQTLALPPIRASSDERKGGRLHRLLVDTGTPEAEAAKIIGTQAQEALDRAAEQEADRREREWREPTDPRLTQRVSLTADRPVYWPDVLRLIAAATDVSIISDHFTRQWRRLPDEAREEIPLWRALHLICYQWGRQFRTAGDCVTFRSDRWWALALREVPESVLVEYRARLESRGTLTLKDLVELAARLSDRAVGRYSFPSDLLVSGLVQSEWALRFCNTLSPDQIAKARESEGLSIEDMTAEQQRRVRERTNSIDPPVAQGAALRPTFHIIEKVQQRDGWRQHSVSLWLQFGDRLDRSGVRYGAPVAEGVT